MSKISQCFHDCFMWARGYTEDVKSLDRQYRQKYKDTQFFQICKIFLRQLHTLNKNGHGKNEYQDLMKSSLIQSIYEQNEIMRESRSRSSESLPSRMGTLSEGQKKELISGLIKKSYILLDISDIFGEEDNKLYQNQIKNKMFENDQSMLMQSFYDGADELANSLRNFNTLTMYKLQRYVEIAEKIKLKYEIESETLLSKFLIQIKAKIIQVFSMTKNIDKLFQNTFTAIKIIESTTKILFKISFGKKENQSREVLNEDSENSANQVQFMNQTNLRTLVVCLFFQQDFHKFFVESLKAEFQKQLRNLKKKTPMLDQEFADYLFHEQSSIPSSFFQPTVASLFTQKKQITSDFEKTAKVFTRLPKKHPPVLKLKVLSQMQRQFLKQYRALSIKKQVQTIYDRSVCQILVKWLLSRNTTLIDQAIPSLILTYSFIDSIYRQSKRGSILLSFIQKIQELLQYQIPTM